MSGFDANTWAYRDSGGNVLFNNEDGIICIEDTTVIDLLTTVTNPHIVHGSCVSNAITVAKEIWHPDFNVGIGSTICDGELVSEVAINTATPVIEYDEWSTIRRGDDEYLLSLQFRLQYLLYNSAGALVDEFVHNWINFPLPAAVPPYPYVAPITPVGATWTPFTLSDAGDHVLVATLYAMGIDTEVELSTPDLLTVGEWYRITDISGGADFTGVGANVNQVFVEFVATGTTPTWGTGKVNLLSPIVKREKTYTIKGCSKYKVEQTACNIYKVTNLSLTDDVTVTVEEMQDDKSFAVVGNVETIDSLDSVLITLPNDGIFTFQIEDGVDTFIYIVRCYCNLEACLLAKIKELICNPVTLCSCGCDDPDDCSCSEVNYYGFNALIINVYTYFALLNDEYNFNFVYEALDTTKINELYEIKKFITRFEDYCEDCATYQSSCGCV